MLAIALLSIVCNPERKRGSPAATIILRINLKQSYSEWKILKRAGFPRYARDKNIMPTIKVNGVKLFYKESGSGPETIVFSHGLLMDHSMFEPQRVVFEKQYRVIAYDHRAQGQSEDIGRGYDMSTIADDAALLIRALQAAPCHFAGLSMGGFAGMRVAAHHPELIRTLTLMNTTATKEEAANRIKYAFLAQLVKLFSLAPFTSIAVKELFGRTTRMSAERRPMLEQWTGKLRARRRKIPKSLSAVMRLRKFP